MTPSLAGLRDHLAVLDALHTYCRCGDAWTAEAKQEWLGVVAPDIQMHYGALGDYSSREQFMSLADNYHERWQAMQHIALSPSVLVRDDFAWTSTPHIAVHVPLGGGPPVTVGTTWLHTWRREPHGWVMTEAETSLVWSDDPTVVPGTQWDDARESAARDDGD